MAENLGSFSFDESSPLYEISLRGSIQALNPGF